MDMCVSKLPVLADKIMTLEQAVEWRKSNITLTDSSNKSVTFTAVRIPGETVADGKQALYLKFTVTGIGSQTYTATVNGEAYFATVNIWKPAQ